MAEGVSNFQRGRFFLVDVLKSPSMTIVWSGGRSLLETEGWVFKACCLKTPYEKASRSLVVGHA